jgi:hypothetical protein
MSTSVIYIPPGLLPAGTPVNTPRPGLRKRANAPNGGGLIAGSGTSLMYVTRRDSGSNL